MLFIQFLKHAKFNILNFYIKKKWFLPQTYCPLVNRWSAFITGLLQVLKTVWSSSLALTICANKLTDIQSKYIFEHLSELASVFETLIFDLVEK